MKLTAKFAGALLGAMTFSGAALASVAGATQPPGERAGLDLASPLPEGVYFVDIGSIGNWRAPSSQSGFDYNVPILAWSTPWQIVGGRLQFYGALPEISASEAGPYLGGAYSRGMYNPFLAASLNWNIGNGISVGLLSGAYIPITGTNVYINGGHVGWGNPWDQTTFQEMLAIAYHGGGWNATANLIFDLIGDNQSPFGITPKKNADSFNYDLGLTHTFGKWEVGIVAYGMIMENGTYNSNIPNDPSAVGVAGAGGVSSNYACASCSVFALGGLVGYNFGPVITQLTVATDLYTHSSQITGAPLGDNWMMQKETRGVLRVIVPLWNPEAPKAVVAKY
jgi:hypothetical protein